MKLALISDLHANVPALEAVLAEAERRAVDRVVCLGDAVDLGPEPGRVIEMLRERQIDTLQGNHDAFDGTAVEPRVVWEWTGAQLSLEERAWLRALPPRLDYEFEGVKLACVHGSPRSADEQILPTTGEAELSQMLAGESCDVLVCGHTHVQFERRLGPRLVVNVGSVGMPFAESLLQPGVPRINPWSEFAVLHLSKGTARADLVQVDYDIDDFFARVLRSTMPDPKGWITAWLPRKS
jgi:putative phosphoesterase